MHDHDTNVMAVKAVTAWLAVFLAKLGIHQWGDLAAMLASLYTFILLCEWAWKKWKGWRNERD